MNSLDQPMNVQPEPSFRPIAIRYGFIAVLLMVVVDLITRFSGFVDPTDPSTAMNGFMVFPIYWIILITTFILAIKKHRDEDLGGFITFGRGFSLAFMAGLVIVAVTILWSFLYVQVIDPDSIEISREMAISQAEDQGASASDVEGSINFFTSPIVIALMAGIFRLLGVVIFGLIAASVAQKKPIGA